MQKLQNIFKGTVTRSTFYVKVTEKIHATDTDLN